MHVFEKSCAITLHADFIYSIYPILKVKPTRMRDNYSDILRPCTYDTDIYSVHVPPLFCIGGEHALSVLFPIRKSLFMPLFFSIGAVVSNILPYEWSIIPLRARLGLWIFALSHTAFQKLDIMSLTSSAAVIYSWVRILRQKEFFAVHTSECIIHHHSRYTHPPSLYIGERERELIYSTILTFAAATYSSINMFPRRMSFLLCTLRM
mmetsp:Transcript_14905/g.22621  ORF Transcript_14905/g.22621 Transcript_14905/m.22621 type:complete len:207 (+) Transcript_14905:38-658(+)